MELSVTFVATRIGARTRDPRCGSVVVLGAGVVSVGRFFPGLLLEGGQTIVDFGVREKCAIKS